jgi:CheY-like chemotaxis protein
LYNYGKVGKKQWVLRMNILVVEDEKDIRDLLRLSLESEGYQVFEL